MSSQKFKFVQYFFKSAQTNHVKDKSVIFAILKDMIYALVLEIKISLR